MSGVGRSTVLGSVRSCPSPFGVAGHTATRDYLANSGGIIRERDIYMSDVRKVTNRLYDLVDEGVITWDMIGRACLSYMSESDVADMAHYNYLIDDDENEAGE